MKKILIVTAGLGEGHLAGARAIRDALELMSDEVKVEILDLFAHCYGSWYDLALRTQSKLARFSPGVWNGVHSLFHSAQEWGRPLGSAGRAGEYLAGLLGETRPDCVVSTSQSIDILLDRMFQDHDVRPFRMVTVATESGRGTFRGPLAHRDLICASNESVAAALRSAGIGEESIQVTGFPVSPAFAGEVEVAMEDPVDGRRARVLYIINRGRKQAGHALDRLMEDERLEVTVTVARDAVLKAEISARAARIGPRIRVLGWTNEMPRLMRRSHLVVGKAGETTVREAIAAACPFIVNQAPVGSDAWSARMVRESGIGAVVDGGAEVARAIERALCRKAKLWKEWKKNLRSISKPDSALRIAELVLTEPSPRSGRGPNRLFVSPARTSMSPCARRHQESPRMLLCDFHIHTNYSDGKLSAPEVVDFYGERGFDCICITDHLADPNRLIGKVSELCGFTLGREQLSEYFDVLERERRRALRKYGMILMTGIEFNKDGFTKKSSAHLLGLDLDRPVDPSLDLSQIISEIHAQGGLAVASHPHIMESEWGKNTLYLWENQEKYAPVLDAWEIANRNNIFNRVGLRRLPFLANSDFHKPGDIYSWKTLLLCGKDRAEIKECIRTNRNVAITLYREGMAAEEAQAGMDLRHEPIPSLVLGTPLRFARAEPQL